MFSIHDEIQNTLDHVEKAYGVRILYACEAGSRAWGVSSQDSDYDVRFIYIHPSDRYLSIDEVMDVIELTAGDHLDVSGWDLRKTLRLFRKSNPSLLEWLQSDIVYAESGRAAQRLRGLIPALFSPHTCVLHYLNMAKRNFRHELQRGDPLKIKIKSVFYVLRPILACQWIDQFGTVPPLSFQALTGALLQNGELSREIETLEARKTAGEQLVPTPHSRMLLSYMEKEIGRIQAVSETLGKGSMKNATPRLDALFRDLLKESGPSP